MSTSFIDLDVDPSYHGSLKKFLLYLQNLMVKI